MIRPYLSNIIDDHKDEWKIQLTMEINFISIKDSSESHPSDSLLEKYQKGLEEKMKKVAILLIMLVYYIINFIKQD